ncbi:hypothetical protein EVAR_78026_1 [Eumeta japonica]|uniref:Uncharacterized protein n=1 Tax=Eumeta variegata TaxID=151549 RepID=A0A4C1T104_EUMVA|nr:hypothetical protein EVAR_78026_1 [Eumeta japonica]
MSGPMKRGEVDQGKLWGDGAGVGHRNSHLLDQIQQREHYFTPVLCDRASTDRPGSFTAAAKLTTAWLSRNEWEHILNLVDALMITVVSPYRPEIGTIPSAFILPVTTRALYPGS